jgi:hypothetical protein
MTVRPVKYQKRHQKKYGIIFILMCMATLRTAQAQDVLLFGTVLNATTRDTLYNINITNLRTHYVRTTQVGNAFLINLSLGDSVVASSVGYEPQLVRYQLSAQANATAATAVATVWLKPATYTLKPIKIYATKTRSLEDAFEDIVRATPEPKTQPTQLQPEPQPRREIYTPQVVSNVEQIYQAFSKSYAQKQIIDEKNRTLALNQAAEYRFIGIASAILHTTDPVQLQQALQRTQLAPQQILMLSDYDLGVIIKKRLLN